jgi:hypothetical protein
MNRMTPDLARLLVDERPEEATQRRRRASARSAAAPALKVTRQRRRSSPFARLVPRTGAQKPGSGGPEPDSPEASARC